MHTCCSDQSFAQTTTVANPFTCRNSEGIVFSHAGTTHIFKMLHLVIVTLSNAFCEPQQWQMCDGRQYSGYSCHGSCGMDLTNRAVATRAAVYIVLNDAGLTFYSQSTKSRYS